MIYRYSTTFQGGAYLFVPCGVVFLSELAEAVRLGLIEVTNLGQLGDDNHTSISRHSPHDAKGKTWVAAFDLGGRDYRIVAEFWRQMWLAGDPRIFRYGFTQRGDGTGLSWTDGSWKWTGKDQGHMHGDFAMARGSIGGRTDTSWWVDVLADTAPWHFVEWLKTGRVYPLGTSPAPTTPALPEDDMAAVPQAEWTDVRDAVKTLVADLAATRAVAVEARRMGEVTLYKRPAGPGEVAPALPAGVVAPAFRDRLKGGESLKRGEALNSEGGAYLLTAQGDGNVVFYRFDDHVVYPFGTTTTAVLTCQTDGNVVAYDARGNAVWHTGTRAAVAPEAVEFVAQGDGNLVVYHDGAPVWATSWIAK